MKNILLILCLIHSSLLDSSGEVSIYENAQENTTYRLGGKDAQSVYAIASRKIIFEEDHDFYFIVNEYLSIDEFDVRFWGRAKNDFVKFNHATQLQADEELKEKCAHLKIDPFINRIGICGILVHGAYFQYIANPQPIFDFRKLGLYPIRVNLRM